MMTDLTSLILQMGKLTLRRAKHLAWVRESMKYSGLQLLFQGPFQENRPLPTI